MTGLLITAMATTLAVCPTARGQFSLVDNFESYAAGPLDGLSDGSGTWTAAPEFEVAVDPTQPNNQVLNVLDAAPTVDAFNNDPALRIIEGATGTQFLGASVFGRNLCLWPIDAPLERVDFTFYGVLNRTVYEFLRCKLAEHLDGQDSPMASTQLVVCLLIRHPESNSSFRIPYLRRVAL